jgi:hypothetical protein
MRKPSALRSQTAHTFETRHYVNFVCMMSGFSCQSSMLTHICHQMLAMTRAS